ncbi:MAG: helix-turn-helix domain-containing protein [Christensenellales bacterium]
MKTKTAVFSNLCNRELFMPGNVVGQKLKLPVYKKIFKDENLIKILENESINQTVDAFIKNGLNLSLASANSYLHRNTLIYRIDKINKMIGLDLKKFEDCMIYVNMRQIYLMVVKQ